jgi:hypothetical protein
LTPIAPWGSVSGPMACCRRNIMTMITKTSGACWRLCSKLQVRMECVATNLHVQFELNPAVYRCTAYSCRRFQRSRDFNKSVCCCLCVYRDTSWWTTADISCLIDIERTVCDGKDVWWFLSQDIPGILHESHANYAVTMYYKQDYSEWSDGQNADFALFVLIKPTNLDIQDAACLHVVHCLQHPTSCPTTRSITRYNDQCSKDKPFPASGKQIWQLDESFYTLMSSGE